MSTVFEVERLLALSPSPAEAAHWTAVIPAAGHGSRLGSASPKILYPVLGRPILDWLIDIVAPFCGNVVVVANEPGKPLIEKALLGRLGSRGRVVIQPAATGMADAVARGVSVVSSDQTLVLWGDQITARVGTLARCIRLHLESGAKLTMLTVLQTDPYIHFERHPDGRIKNVYQRRESDQLMREGEADAGLFFFQTGALRSLLAEALPRPEMVGKKTGEINLLAMFPMLDRVPGDILSARIGDVTETLGLNSPEEARRVEEVLSTRRRTG